jgi:hypothetical protein
MSWQNFASFVKTLFRGPGGRPVRPARPGWRPSLEMLEDRAVPSAGGLGHARLLVHAPHMHSQVGEERLEQQAERREDRVERMNHTNNPTEEKAERLAEHKEELREVKVAGRGHAHPLVHGRHMHSQAGEERLEQQAERREDRLERMNHTNNPREEKAEVRAEHREELREVKVARTTATPSAGRALGHSPQTNNGLHLGQHM